VNVVAERNIDIHYTHLIDRLLGREEAYEHFLTSEAAISADILRISLFSEQLLATVNYSEVIKQRLANFSVYTAALSHCNALQVNLEDINKSAVPFCYPLLINKEIPRSILSQRGLFIPTLWRDTVTRNTSDFLVEKTFSLQLLPLPVDHRYDTESCQQLLDILLEYL